MLFRAQMHETRHAHRDVVTHVVVTPFTHFIVTASRDGQIKFWKKQQVGIEFVKHYRAHLAPITSMAASPDGVCSPHDGGGQGDQGVRRARL